MEHKQKKNEKKELMKRQTMKCSYNPHDFHGGWLQAQKQVLVN
jgi:hypothetical protein